jgi:hypothetical protein
MATVMPKIPITKSPHDEEHTPTEELPSDAASASVSGTLNECKGTNISSKKDKKAVSLSKLATIRIDHQVLLQSHTDSCKSLQSCAAQWDTTNNMFSALTSITDQLPPQLQLQPPDDDEEGNAATGGPADNLGARRKALMEDVETVRS